MRKVPGLHAALIAAAMMAVVWGAAGEEVRGTMVSGSEREELSAKPLQFKVGYGKEADAILALFDRYVDCIVTHDADGWLALWDANGVQLPPDSPMCVGKPAIRVGNFPIFQDPSKRWAMNIRTQEVQVFPAEGYAFARGVYDWTCTPAGGGDGLCYDGKFMTVFRRQPDGSWLIYRDIFNSNL